MVDYYLHDGPTAFRFQLIGIINDEAARRLEQVWCTSSSLTGDRRPIIDITFVTSVDEHGCALLQRWHREGAQFEASSKASHALAESVLGTDAVPSPVKSPRCLPFGIGFLKSAVSLPFLLAALLLTCAANAATLKPETVAAWDDYVATTQASLQERIRPNGDFLWTFENPDRVAQVRAGEIVVAPAAGQNPKKVPGGLIHHWMGAMFVPDLTVDQVLQVTRNYDRYKEYYRPSVVDSKTKARDDTNDQFSMRIMNKAFFLKVALDADYQATYVRLDEKRIYSISRTTRVQEIHEYGLPAEHAIPEGEGGGYVWKVLSIARLEQRDSGVYVELEAVALSRPIPVAARLVVDPIVRRVSRSALLVSLQQTEHALNGKPASNAGRPGSASDADPAQNLPPAK